MFIWWLGWYPGFATSDTVDQLIQAQTGVYLEGHPPVHTLYLDLLALGGSRPGVVTLFQIVVFAVLLAYGANRLVGAGVPTWLAVGAAWLLGLSPAVAPTTIALWKDVPFALFLLWAWIELLGLTSRDRSDGRPWPMVRLGFALSGVWLFRANGPLTVIGTLVVLAVVYRRALMSLLPAFGVVVASVVLATGPLYGALDVRGEGIDPAQVFLPELASSFTQEPESFDTEELALLEDLAPLNVWVTEYDCYDSTPLLFDERFDQAALRDSPGAYRSLEFEVLLRDPDSVGEHRLCAANFLYWPPQPQDAVFQRLPYFMPENDIGLGRFPKWEAAFFLTNDFWHWAESDDLLWLTWRPAVVILPALGAMILFAIRPKGRRFLIPSSLFFLHLLNVAATSPNQEFRYAYPLYILGVLTLTLVYPTLRGDPNVADGK
jgi:hypothetical protein